MTQQDYVEKVYAGVLGKMIGVFHGRPVEGWPYEKIRKTFGIVDHYIYQEVGTPLIVADDDMAGTFTFLNAIEDCADISKLTARDFGNMWLDYIIEDKTIFWWGGLGRSTEHTAYLRLKAGMTAPESGSIKTNGKGVAEQIGAQIFIDALAMMCPNDPEMSRYLVKQSASVSHDGIAVESACFLAGMESMAFGERNLSRLVEESFHLGMGEELKKIIEAVREECSRTNDFRKIRDWLDIHFGYQLYPGNCHVIPNIALLVACLILGEEDFAKGMNYCVSAGWDTDCNGANLGCLNGIRLGLSSINKTFDYRSPLGDRFYNISAEGGNCVTNAERETYRIVALKQKLYKEAVEKPKKRFSFLLPGSVQGFCGCPFLGNEKVAAVNGNQLGKGNGILIKVKEETAAFSTPVMWDRNDRQANYCLTGSPLLYEGQTVEANFRCVKGKAKVRLYIISYDFNDLPIITYANQEELSEVDKCRRIQFKIPQAGGQTIGRIGVEVRAEEGTTEVLLCDLDWKDAPQKYEIKGSLRNYDQNGLNMMMEAFVSSAKQYSFDSKVTFTISHTEKNGVVTTGTEDWKNYSIRSKLIPGIHHRFGMVGRCRGHRRYYAVVFWNNDKVGILKKRGEEERLLVVADFPYQNDQGKDVCLSFDHDVITVSIDGIKILKGRDAQYTQGGAGYVVDYGTVLADGFCIEAI